MCNLYSITTNEAAHLALFRGAHHENTEGKAPSRRSDDWSRWAGKELAQRRSQPNSAGTLGQ